MQSSSKLVTHSSLPSGVSARPWVKVSGVSNLRGRGGPVCWAGISTLCRTFLSSIFTMSNPCRYETATYIVLPSDEITYGLGLPPAGITAENDMVLRSITLTAVDPMELTKRERLL